MADPSVAIIHERMPPTNRLTPAVVETETPLTVMIDGSVQPAHSWLGGWQNRAGDRVLVIRGEGRVEIVGSKATRPTSAVVASSGSGRVTVTDPTGRTISGLPYVGAVPENGTRVGLIWGQDGGFACGVLSQTVGSAPSTLSTEDPLPPELPPAVTPGTVTNSATDSSTARSGSWRSDGRTGEGWVFQGHWTSGSTADNTGFWFYGRTLVVSGATASGTGTIRLRRDSIAGMPAAANIYLARHGSHTKPGSPPALIGSATLIGTLRYGQTDTFALPAGFAQDLLSGTAGGVAVVYAGTTNYAAFAGPDADPSAALISLPYTREA